MKYAGYLPELRRRESWEEICKRCEDMMVDKYPLWSAEILPWMQYVYERKVLPSMRHAICRSWWATASLFFIYIKLIFVMTYPIDLSHLLEKKKRKMIPIPLFEKYKARLVNVKKNQVLFEEGDPARDFFQVEQGQIKMYIINPEGQEFTQGIFHAGESFGEPALLGDFPYPSNAMAMEHSKVWRLPKPEFFQLLKENFDVHLRLNQVLCKRLQYKTMILTEVSSYDPEHRLMTLLKYFKSKLVKKSATDKIIIPFTRQQLADMTGLRVETVIRSIKKMERDARLQLDGHKIKF